MTLKQLRTHLDLTQVEMSKRLSVERATYTQWESGRKDRKPFGREVALKISKMFGVTACINNQTGAFEFSEK